MEADKFLKKSVSIPGLLCARAEEKADDSYSGNLSAYIVDLIRRDLGKSKGNIPHDVDVDAISDLAERWLDPMEAMRMKMVFRQAREGGYLDQRLELQALLRGYLGAAEANGFPGLSSARVIPTEDAATAKARALALGIAQKNHAATSHASAKPVTP